MRTKYIIPFVKYYKKDKPYSIINHHNKLKPTIALMISRLELQTAWSKLAIKNEFP
jgi:hypothetical protein